jgi:hypothetical protein
MTARATSQRHGRGRVRTLLLAALAAAAVFASLELLVRGLGVGDPPPGARGFSTRARYLGPDPETPGRWRTRYDMPEGAELVIPPKGAARRIVVVGSSNALGLAFGDLEGQLAALAGEERYEVVHLGRPGYGSERVALLTAEVVAQLEPDLLVVYLGDAELAEALDADERDEAVRFERARLAASGEGLSATEADGTGGDRTGGDRTGSADTAGALSGLVNLARRSRLVELFLAAVASPARDVPEPWIRRPPGHDDRMTPEDADHLYSELARNLESICRSAATHDVPVVLSTVIYNRFSAPFGSAFPVHLDDDARATFEQRRGLALKSLPEFLAPLLPERPADRVLPRSWRMAADTVEDPSPGRELPGRRPCTGRLADVDPELLPRENWGPAIWRLYECLERVHFGTLSAEERAALERAEGHLRQALAICADHPRALFELGLVGLVLQRDPDEVRRLLERAALRDRAPHKASDRLNDMVRGLAATEPGARLFDADALFAERMPGGLVGWEWMLDECHLQIGARRVLMGDLARFVVEQGL